MLSRTAARARSAQGASQFAAGYAAVRLTHHSDDRPVHLTKTSQVTARLCLRMSRDLRVQIGPFCPRRSFISLSRVQIVGFCPRRLIYVCIFGLSAPVVLLIVRHVYGSVFCHADFLLKRFVFLINCSIFVERIRKVILTLIVDSI